MAFSWGGQGQGNSDQQDQGESPASSGSGATSGRGFWLGGAGSDRSEDESDGGYGLFNNDFAGFSNANTGEGLSMDFWNIEDIKPMNLGGSGGNNSSNIGNQFNARQTGQYEDPLLKARKEMLLGSSPDAMETFDDLAGFGAPSQASQPSNTFKSSSNASNVFGLYSGAQNNAGNTPQSMDPSALFGSAASSVFASPSSSSTSGGINLQDILSMQPQASSSSSFAAFGGQGMIGQQQQQSQLPGQQQQQQGTSLADPAGLLSPQSFFQQLSFSSGTSDPTNSSSSRDSSSDPPGGQRRESASASDTGNYSQQPSTSSYNSNISPSSADKTSSSTSTTRISTAANSPPTHAHNNVGLRQSKSGSSLASQGADRSHQMTMSHSHNGSNMLSMPDKVSQQQAAETAGMVKHVIRDNNIRAPDGSSICQLLILGLPDEGARSRVETQVKVGLILLRPKAKAQATQTALNYKDSKGALLPGANDHFDKVGNWKYLALPAVSSVKRRARKHFKASVPPEETLFADIKVVSASVPSREIAICQNCQQREVKRLQRKTQNRSKPSGDIDSGKEDEEGMSEDELAKRKIVLFNCGQYLEFNNGETVIPTRITCYCRHHKEKYGFMITYTLTDHLGQVVATAASPPIFLTDDHKAKPTKPDNIDLNHITSLARVANGPNGGISQKSSAWNSAASSMPSSAASSQASSAASSAVPSRSNSVENLEELHQSGSSTASRSRKDRSSKPYNLDSRPNKGKKNTSLNRLNSFTMTPLNLSAPGSPRAVGPSPLTSSSHLPTDYITNSAAPLQNFSDMLQTSTAEANNLNASLNDHTSPNSSQSAPSTPGHASLDSFSTSFPSQAGLSFGGPSSMTSTSDELASTGARSVDQSPMYSNATPLPQLQQSNLSQHLASLNMINANAGQAQQPRPRISRIIPNEGPTHGGTEVIILGDNFTAGLEVTFGETPAVSAQAWGGNTLVCILPPSPSPGPVVVAFKNVPLAVNDNSGLQLFTYIDTSDKALMELALQVVGMKMSGGRIEDARNVARRIIGAGGGVNPGFPQGGALPTQQAGGNNMAGSTGHFIAAMNAGSETRDFQAMIMKVLGMLDVDYSDSAPELPSNPIDHVNDQKQTLLHLAAVLGFHRLVSWLIERDAALDLQDKHGYTPLHLAALCGRVTITRQLLQAGAVHDVTNNAGQTPVDIARQRDQIDVEALFTRHAPSRSGSLVSLPHVAEEEEEWSPLSGSPRSPGAAKLFRLASRSSSQYDSDSDSDWSNDDEAHFASESELESHITRLSRNHSSTSLTHERSFSNSSSSKSSRPSDVTSPSPRTGSPSKDVSSPEESDGASTTTKFAWMAKMPSSKLASRFSRLKLPTPPSLHSWRGIASAAMSSSPSAASFSLSSSISSPVTAQESEAELPHWPASLLHSIHIPISKTDASGVRASLGRKLGYSIDHITEDALRSYSYHAQKYGGTLRKDKMLYFFWLPLFMMAMIWIYCQASAFVTSTLGIVKDSVVSHVSDLRIIR